MGVRSLQAGAPKNYPVASRAAPSCAVLRCFGEPVSRQMKNRPSRAFFCTDATNGRYSDLIPGAATLRGRCWGAPTSNFVSRVGPRRRPPKFSFAKCV